MNPTRALPATTVLAPLCLMFLAACAPKYYSPNAQNVPLLTREGEGSAGASLNPDASRADVHGALALTNKVAIQGKGAFYFPRDDSAGDGGSGGLIELGIGYIRPLPENFAFETYLLGAYGGVENHFPSAASENPGTSGKLNANLTRFSIQPAIGYKSRYFEGAVSSRMAILNYFNVDGDLVTSDGSQQEYLRDNRMQFLLEPAITLRGGLDPLKAEAQIGWSVNLTDTEFPQDKNWVSLGLVYAFDP